MNIFITGGTGLTGGRILERLAGEGHSITAIYRNRKSNTAGVNWVQYDIDSGVAALRSIIGENEIVIHNAACIKPGNNAQELEEINAVNIEFTKTLLDALLNFKVKKIIFTGSFSVMKRPLPDLVTEESDVDPITPYSKSKFEGEQMIKEFAVNKGISYNILRISSPVDFELDKMHRNVLKTWIEKSRKNESLQVFGDGERTQDFVSTSDIASAFSSSVKHLNVSGTFNIASGKPVSMKSVAKLITNKFGNSFYFSGTDTNGSERWNISIEKAGKALGFQPEFTSEGAIQKLLS